MIHTDGRQDIGVGVISWRYRASRKLGSAAIWYVSMSLVQLDDLRRVSLKRAQD